MGKLIATYAVVYLLVTGCAANPSHAVSTDGDGASNREALLYQTASGVLEPMAHHVNHDEFVRIEQLAVNSEVGCELSILKQKASDQELGVLVYLWGSGKKVSKADAISKFGDATYLSAIEKYVLANTTCMAQTSQLIYKLKSTIEGSN